MTVAQYLLEKYCKRLLIFCLLRNYISISSSVRRDASLKDFIFDCSLVVSFHVN